MVDSPHLHLASCNFFLQKEGFFKPFGVFILGVKGSSLAMQQNKYKIGDGSLFDTICFIPLILIKSKYE